VGIFEALYAVYQVFSHDPRVWWWKSRAGENSGDALYFISSALLPNSWEKGFQDSRVQVFVF